MVAITGLAAALSMTSLQACPFCTAASQTLRQEMTSMDVVGFAKIVSSDVETIDGQATFEITDVVRGESFANSSDTLVAPYFGPGKTEKTFLVMAVRSGDELLWSSPMTLTDASKDYVQKLFKLSDDSSERLRFFMNYLESPEPLLAGDAYDEFALAPYEQIKKVKDALDREKLWGWLDDKNVSPDRKRLYYTLLGVVAADEDASRLEKKLRSTEPNDHAGLDALIACYLTVSGEKALPTIDDLFLTNTKCAYGDTYAAIMALRFQGTDGNAIDRKLLLNSMRHLLDRPDYADLVIPDLARWEDWSQIDKLVELFEKADDSNSWVRVPVINYLRACPLPVAKEKLAYLETIDPKAVQRATTFFPITPSVTEPSSGDSSMNVFPSSPTGSVDVESYSPLLASDTPSLILFHHLRDEQEKSFGQFEPRVVAVASPPAILNRVAASCVALLATASFGCAMALLISGRSGGMIWINQLRQILHSSMNS